MSMLKTRLQSRMDKRDVVAAKRDELLREAGDGELSDASKKTVELYREEIQGLDVEIEQLTADAEAADRAEEAAKALKRAQLAQFNGGDGEDGVVYRSMAEYARDVILSREGQTAAMIRAQFGDKQGIEAAKSRLELLQRTPANTLSSNVAGLIPQQHIAEIFQVINESRPIVNSAQRATLERGVLAYPRVDTKPVVAVQSSEKTEAGNTGMAISMQTATASTYLGGGDLSWQAINWSTPNALDLWFRLTAADYALKTEQDAAQVLQHSAFTFNTSTTLGASPTFAEFMTAVGAGYGEVWSGSGRVINTIYMAPDRYGYLLGLTSTAPAMFSNVSTSQIAGLDVVVSRGMDAGVIVVGDRNGLLVAETAGAPVELRVTEPAIGGVEVGLIGAFEAVVVDAGAFSMITTAS
jgi:HK97 family phage major capsid protein